MTDTDPQAREYDNEVIAAIAQHFRTIVLSGIDPNRWPYEAQARRLVDFMAAAGMQITRRGAVTEWRGANGEDWLPTYTTTGSGDPDIAADPEEETT